MTTDNDIAQTQKRGVALTVFALVLLVLAIIAGFVWSVIRKGGLA